MERARSSALTHRDLQALQSMRADDLIYCHANGRCENKAQLRESLQSSGIGYRGQFRSLRPRTDGGRRDRQWLKRNRGRKGWHNGWWGREYADGLHGGIRAARWPLALCCPASRVAAGCQLAA
jgi:hypothetical protein